MDDVFVRATSKGDPCEEARRAVGWFEEDFPTLADLLGGRVKKGGEVVRLPGSLRLFTNGGELKAEVTGQDWVMKGYLLIPKGVLSIDVIESELAAGHIGWSTKAERKDSYPKLPH